MHHQDLVSTLIVVVLMMALHRTTNAFSRVALRPSSFVKLSAAVGNNAKQTSLFSTSPSTTSTPAPSAPSSSSPSSLRLTTYNVLSSSLAGPGYFTSCEPEYLDQKYRLNILKV
jgi:hypothetical protein